jgi:hypothetical protein
VKVNALRHCAITGAFQGGAKTRYHVRSPARLLHSHVHGIASSQQIRLCIVQHAAGSLGVGQYGSQGLVDFVGYAGRQFAQGAQSGELPHALAFLFTPLPKLLL